MKGVESIAVRRPQRWDEPMDPSMTDADVVRLRSLEPFASLDPSVFPRSIPLQGILRNDCRLHRFQPGELVVREGDYGNSAFLVLGGSVGVLVDSLPAERLGRTSSQRISWGQALMRSLRGSRHAESREPAQVSPPSVLRQGESWDHPTIFLQDFDALLRGTESISLGPGELFGEVAAMYRSPRTATVMAMEEATLLEIRWQGLRVLRRDRNFSDRLEAHYRANWLEIHLRETPLLRYLPETSLRRVAEATMLRSFGRLEWNADYQKTRRLSPAEQIASEPVVSEEGQQPTELVIVRSGFGRVSRGFGAGHRTTAYVGKGHLFGLEELAHNVLRPEGAQPWPLQSSLRAVGFLDTLHIPVECFAEEILPHVRRSELPEVVSDWLTASPGTSDRERRKSPRSERDHPSPKADESTREGSRFEQTDLLEFVVQHRFNNGREAMLIDLHRCTRCDDCVRACSDVHDGNPRFSRQGPRHGRLQFTQACMHCSDPVCMIGCPTGAIARDRATGVVEIHESICVGCGMCAAACPYDTIQMVEVVDRQGRQYRDERSGKPITKATKCDMCSGSPSGPACVAACPHDALVRIDLRESKPLDAWLERRS